MLAFGQFSGHDHKQQIKINYREEISIKTHAKKIKGDQISKIVLQAFGKFLAMSTKQLRINYIQQISIKSDVKKIKYYHISKK